MDVTGQGLFAREVTAGRGRQCRATQIHLMQFCRDRKKIRGKQENPLGTEGPADPHNRGSELLFEKSLGIGRRDGGLERTFEDVGQGQSHLLELGEGGFPWLPFRADLRGVENGTRFAAKLRLRRVQKILVRLRGNATEKERLDVYGTKAGGPFETLKTARDVRKADKLAAAVAGEQDRIAHVMLYIVEHAECRGNWMKVQKKYSPRLA